MHPYRKQASESAINAQHWRNRYIRISLALVSALVAVIAGNMFTVRAARASSAQAHSARIAQAYSCGNGTGGTYPHCYAQYEWPGTTNGSITWIFITQLTCNSSCSNQSGWVDNETWLEQQNPGDYWVESGYMSYPPGPTSSDSYFWADNRPTYGYTWHDFGQVPSGDYQHNTTFELVKDGSGTFEVYLSSYTKSFYAYSTSNSMSANQIVIGQELAGTGGASAPTSYLSHNQWIDSNDHPHYQTNSNSDDLDSDNPPYASWFITPQNSTTGGSLQTSCC